MAVKLEPGLLKLIITRLRTMTTQKMLQLMQTVIQGWTDSLVAMLVISKIDRFLQGAALRLQETFQSFTSTMIWIVKIIDIVHIQEIRHRRDQTGLDQHQSKKHEKDQKVVHTHVDLVF